MAGGTLKALLVDAYYSTSGTRLFSRTVCILHLLAYTACVNGPTRHGMLLSYDVCCCRRPQLQLQTLYTYVCVYTE
jgi:hypothetical protein